MMKDIPGPQYTRAIERFGMTFVRSMIQADIVQATAQLPLEQEMALLIVESLQLEIDAAEIVPLDALFYEGLGLDSIDALEMALAISRRYGIELASDDVRNGEIFASLRSLCAFVEANRTR